MLKYEQEGGEVGMWLWGWDHGIIAQGQSGHQFMSGEQLHCASLILYILLLLLSSSSSPLLSY